MTSMEVNFEPNEHYNRPVERSTGHEAYVTSTPHPAHEEGHATFSGLCNLSGCEYTPEFLAGVREPSVVDQQPTDMVPKPALCGTFAVYPLEDGQAGLVLDVQGEGEPRKMLLPKLVVDMVMYGQRPSAKDAMAFFMGRK